MKRRDFLKLIGASTVLPLTEHSVSRKCESLPQTQEPAKVSMNDTGVTYYYWDESIPNIIQMTNNFVEASGRGRWIMQVKSGGVKYPCVPCVFLHGGQIMTGTINIDDLTHI